MMKSQTEQQRKSILAENSNNLPSNYWKPEIESDWMKAQARPASQPDSDRVHGVMQFLSSANKIITFDTEYSMILWHCFMDAEYDAGQSTWVEQICNCTIIGDRCDSSVGWSTVKPTPHHHVLLQIGQTFTAKNENLMWMEVSCNLSLCRYGMCKS